MRLSIGNSDPTWVNFEYERLPLFCYRCGIIGHNEKDCFESFTEVQKPMEREYQYDPWLRVNQPTERGAAVESRGARRAVELAISMGLTRRALQGEDPLIPSDYPQLVSRALLPRGGDVLVFFRALDSGS
ncbi:hypothetical protein U1Q18_022402 [Sarracenia purpurea var. burkii]